MNITASTSSAVAKAQRPPPRQGEDPMKAVAEKLDSGKSVSRDDLLATIRSGQPAGGSPTAAANNQGRPPGPPSGPPPGGPKGELSGLSTDDGTVEKISSLLDTDAEEVRKVNSASELVKMFQDRGVDLNALRSVLNSGDLLDVAA